MQSTNATLGRSYCDDNCLREVDMRKVWMYTEKLIKRIVDDAGRSFLSGSLPLRAIRLPGLRVVFCFAATQLQRVRDENTT